jgi:hypothetical protein
MNERDSEEVLGMLAAQGYEVSDFYFGVAPHAPARRDHVIDQFHSIC